MSRVDVMEAAPAVPKKAGDHSFASASVGAHLRRGLLGFAPIALAVFLWPRVGWIALAPAALGVVALRGCPMCWTIGLIQTVTRQRVRRVCTEDGCRLDTSRPPSEHAAGSV